MIGLPERLVPRGLKLVRGTAGMGVVFAACFSGVYVVLITLEALFLGHPLDSGLTVAILLGAAPLGFVTGVLFSVVFAVLARGRSLDEIPGTVFAAVGAVAGLLFWILFMGAFGGPAAAAFLAVVSAAIAAGVHRLARRIR